MRVICAPGVVQFQVDSIPKSKTAPGGHGSGWDRRSVLGRLSHQSTGGGIKNPQQERSGSSGRKAISEHFKPVSRGV